MKTLSVCCALALLYSPALLAQTFPADVTAFIERRDKCDHFRGEEPYDAERRRFIAQNIKTWCSGSDKQLAKLRRAYQGNPAIKEKLAAYEDKIEF